MGRAGLVPLFLRPASLEFHRPALVREQRRSCPAIVGLFGEEMPAQDRQLAGEGDRGDLVAAFCSDSDEEGMQRAWRLGGSPCRFNPPGPRLASTALADASLMPWPPRTEDTRWGEEWVNSGMYRGCPCPLKKKKK